MRRGAARQADPAAGAGAGPRDRLSHGGGGRRGLALRLRRDRRHRPSVARPDGGAADRDAARGEAEPKALSPADADYSAAIEATDWGPAHRALPPVRVAGAAMGWTRPASRLGSAPAAWGA